MYPGVQVVYVHSYSECVVTLAIKVPSGVEAVTDDAAASISNGRVPLIVTSVHQTSLLFLVLIFKRRFTTRLVCKETVVRGFIAAGPT